MVAKLKSFVKLLAAPAFFARNKVRSIRLKNLQSLRLEEDFIG